MPKKRRITVELSEDATDEEYVHLANTLWAVARLSPSFESVHQDGVTDVDYLNGWWVDKGHVRWPK
ncbi:hypothetical protein [Micromonospora sp. NPDC005203]|uniref:hypothetical protein n=1 Tax=Micromonospora sp. NPDC005203 TaxID=3364226 RepID=UPI0036B13A75